MADITLKSKRIDELPTTATLNGNELFPISQDAVTKRADFDLILNWIRSKEFSTYVYSNSASLNNVFSLTGNYTSVYSTITGISSVWNASRTYVNSNSASLNNVYSLTSNYASVYSTVNVISSFWDSSRTYVNSNSASLNNVFSLTGNYTSVYSTVNVISSFWDSSRTYVNSNSASLNNVFSLTGNYTSVYSAVNGISSFWDASRTYVNSNSASLNNVFSLTGNYTSVYSKVQSSSANWDLVYSGGYQGTDIKQITASFVRDGGNTRNSNLAIGTNDNFNLKLETNGIDRLIISSTGEISAIGNLQTVTTTETKATPSIVTSTLTLDLTSATLFVVNLNSDITTVNLSNPPTSPKVYGFTLQFINDGTSRLISWPNNVYWEESIPPDTSITLNKVDTFVFITHDGGAKYYGFTSGKNF